MCRKVQDIALMLQILARNKTFIAFQNCSSVPEWLHNDDCHNPGGIKAVQVHIQCDIIVVHAICVVVLVYNLLKIIVRVFVKTPLGLTNTMFC